MAEEKSKERHDFTLAFELAYCIHVDKEIAFFIAEDALEEIPLMLGNQEKNRKPSEQLSGFWKWGERTRPIRKTVRLTEAQMLQWLVYKHSESWERDTERGIGLYVPTEEDMIVRYLEHLIFLTLRRGSFYVTLAVAQLLHQFDRRETRLFYDVLTQSDSARMKEMGYIGKQRLELLGRVCWRFAQMIQTTQVTSGEKQLLTRPTTQSVISLVHECLRRFTPWESRCVIQAGFAVTDIPELYFSGSETSDEDVLEMNRIHALLHPDCFARFVDGLRKYVSTLPGDNQDRVCNFGALDERLVVPLFSNGPDRPSRGDRFQPPMLTQADYIRLERTVETRARRRKSFTPIQLLVYVDYELLQAVEVKRVDRLRFSIPPEAGIIEVRGKDAAEELTLAILLVDCDLIPSGRFFRGSVIQQGGQRVEIQLTPMRRANGDIDSLQVEVGFAQTPSIGDLPGMLKRSWAAITARIRVDRDDPESLSQGYGWLVKVGITAALILAALALLWLRLPLSQPERRPPEQVEIPPAEKTPETPNPPQRPPANQGTRLIARARWSLKPQDALLAIPIEPTRGETRMVDFSQERTRILLSLPLYDDQGNAYSRYRMTLIADDQPLWRQSLGSQALRSSAQARILDLTLFSEHLRQKRSIAIRIEGQRRNLWESLGQLLLRPKE